MTPPNGYLELRLEDFLDEVGSADLAPGGGSVAALAAAMAAGLVAMAARLSQGHWREAEGAAAQAETLRLRLTPLVDLNVEAYLGAVAALRGADGAETGSSGDAERSAGGPGARDDAIARALDRAAEIPLQIGAAASDIAALAAVVAERGQPGVRADVATAAVLANAAARAAEAIVEVNLTTTPDDQRVASARKHAAAAEAAAAQALAAVG